GTIGAASNNGTGVAGINWQSLILPVRVLGRCGGAISDIADGMRWAAGLPVPGAPANSHPARVINLSLGGLGTCGTTYQDAIHAIVAAGATVVVAAGNSNADAGLYRPANCDDVITVAATNRNGSRASYSNFGSVVEISAPGGETMSTSANGVLSTLNTGTQGPVAATYAYYQGTSMAAPHVAGVASLLYSLNPGLTPAQILAILQSTVTHFPAGSTCNTSDCGAGIVNAGAAVAAVASLPTATPTATPTVTPTRTPTPTGTITPFRFVRLPLLLHNYPPVPAAPSLHEIANADGDGNYTVSWDAAPRATSYELQEDDNSSFTSPDTRYTGAGLAWSASGKAPGTYYYRAHGQNAWGYGGWSNVVSVVVQPPSGPQPGFWRHPNGNMEFYVTADRRYVDDFAIYVNVSGCGFYKITHLSAEPISDNRFAFSGPFYASGNFNAQTAASGTTGLSNFYIANCGYVTGGPWTWTANWMHAAGQGMPAEANAVERVAAAPPDRAFTAERTP
ncbi:MAG: S8 family serine peptidase, partial [Anaerolineae bacterium]|nr:S8 family serine peptidase [Anaerolineae bacterium]